jgi:hypothetical protein
VNEVRGALKADAIACLGEAKPAAELVDCVASHFPAIEVYRQNDDLVIKGGGRFLIVRRLAPDRFRVSENIAVPSTNLLDYGGGTDRSLEEVIADIAELAN